MVFIQATLIFLGLTAFYGLLYKSLRWSKSFIQPIATRVRVGVYLLIPLVTLHWIGSKLSHGGFAETGLPAWFSWLPRYGINGLLVFIVLETLLGLVFDYHYRLRRGIAVPQIMQVLARSLLYLLVLVLVLLHLVDIKIAIGVLIGATILLLGIGLLMQDALGNIVAGVSLQITRLYQPGDWLRVGTREGQVETADWRALTLRTPTGDRLILPFSLLAKEDVVNLTAGECRHADEVHLVVDYEYPPERVERALQAALSETDGICEHPAPEVRLLAFLDQGIRYGVRFWMPEFDRRDAIVSGLHRAIWYHFRREEIRFACPTTDIYLRQRASVADATGERVTLLRGIAFLQILSSEQVQRLAERLHRFLYARGEVICRQGDPGQTFYVITRGSVNVTARDDAGREVFTQTLHAGNFFGEFSLLTGEARTATVTAHEETEVLVMAKEDMREALEANAELAEHISGILAQRQHELQERRACVPATPGCPPAAPQTVDSLKREILHRIVDFFAF